MASIPPDKIPFSIDFFQGSKDIPKELDQVLVRLSQAISDKDETTYRQLNKQISDRYHFNLMAGTVKYPTVSRLSEFQGLRRGQGSPIESSIDVIRDKAKKCLGVLTAVDPDYYQSISPVKGPTTYQKTIMVLIGLTKALKIALNRILHFSISLSLQDKIACLKLPPLFDKVTRKRLALPEVRELLQEREALINSFTKQLASFKALPAREKREKQLALSFELDQAVLRHLQSHALVAIEALNSLVNKVASLKEKPEGLVSQVTALSPLRSALHSASLREISESSKEVTADTKNIQKLLKSVRQAVDKLEQSLEKLAPSKKSF